MDWLKAQLERVQRQLAGLSATQKMLTASLVAIMVITVVWWGKYAGEAEMVALLNQSFPTDDIGKIKDHLANKGYAYTVSGDKILVPADKRMEILSDLTYARMMPQSTSAGFDDILKQMSPFDSTSKQEMIWNRGKEMMLSRIIGGFPDVAWAEVLIDPNVKQRLEGGQEKSATVNINTRGGHKSVQQLVDAAADAVVGAEAGLSLSHVKVVVDGFAKRVHDAENDPLGDGDRQLFLLQENAAYHEKQIRALIADVPSLLVTVTVKLNTTTTSTQQETFDAKGALSKEQRILSEKEETSSPVQQGGEAGAQPNTGANVQSGATATAQATQSHNKEETTIQNFVPTTRTTTHTPAGGAVPIAAAVRVPLSYFVATFHAMDSTIKEPNYKQLQPIIQAKSAEMKESIMKCVGLASPNDVSITTYVDPAPVLSPGAAGATQSAGSIPLMLGGHAKEIALGVLALMSLFMASMMVRKGAPVAVPLAAKPPAPAGPPAVLEAGEPLAGEAGEGNPLLDGMELNEDAVRAQQMVDQVSTMVKENPDAAANLVKRWLNRS